MLKQIVALLFFLLGAIYVYDLTLILDPSSKEKYVQFIFKHKYLIACVFFIIAYILFDNSVNGDNYEENYEMPKSLYRRKAIVPPADVFDPKKLENFNMSSENDVEGYEIPKSKFSRRNASKYGNCSMSNDTNELLKA
jgi:hypothetical protein